MWQLRNVKLWLAGLALALGCTHLVQARGPEAALAQDTITVAQLPRQGIETYQLIQSGGPFPYEKDGTVFGNRERLLPAQPRGFYREYTVATPGARDRGTRRIVCGGPAKVPEVCFYTADHYASFRRIVP
jgi:ribonuclease T1